VKEGKQMEEKEIFWVDIFGNEVKRDVYKLTGADRDTMKYKEEVK
jgi:hypothetical protein